MQTLSRVSAEQRALLHLYVLLRPRLAEEHQYLPLLEGGVTPLPEAALARAIDHLAAQPL